VEEHPICFQTLIDNFTDLDNFSMSTVLDTKEIVPFHNWLCYEWARRDPRHLVKSAALGTSNPNAWKNVETKTIGFRMHPQDPALSKPRSTSLDPADSEYYGDVEEVDDDDDFTEYEPTPLFLRQEPYFDGPRYIDNNPNGHNTSNDRDSGCAVESYDNSSVPKGYLTIIR
jgi:hypothetical protein